MFISPQCNSARPLRLTVSKSWSNSLSETRYTSEFYLLDALYVAWLLREAPGAEYMKQLREHGLSTGFVSVTDRKHVTDWLKGKISDNERIAPLSCELFLVIFTYKT